MTVANKILIDLHYWKGDFHMFQAVARLVADIESGKQGRADILVGCKEGAELDQGAIEHLSYKFQVFSQVIPRVTPHEQGGPDVWYGGMKWAMDNQGKNGVPLYKAVLHMDADCVPLTADWIARLHQAWDAAKTNLVGPGAMSKNPPGRHINSNALWNADPKYLKKILWLVKEKHRFGPGFDFFLAQDFKKLGAKETRAIRSQHMMASMSQAQFQQVLREGAVLFHGVRDFSLLGHARGSLGV